MAMGPRKMGMRKMIGMKRAGAKMPKAMKAPKAMGPAELEGQVPPMAGPMPQGIPGMKKGGEVKKGFSTKGGRGGVAERGLGKATKGFAKGGSVDKKTWGSTEDIVGKGPSPAAAKADYAKKMKAAGLKPKMAKGGMAKAPKAGLGIMIILGKKKGK